MPMLRRVFLFFIVNALVLVTLSILLAALGISPYLSEQGLNYASLAIFCFVWGMGGSFISLLVSRKVAKWSMRVQLIHPERCSGEQKILYNMVKKLADRAHLPGMPEVGIFQSVQPNAFATGPSAKRSLVAVSTGLMENMNPKEIEAVIGHEIAHIANGDMVTMTLLQGVVNAFVMFLARVLAFAIMTMNRNRGRGSSFAMFYILQVVFEIIFMLFGSMVIAAFSRSREFRADAGSAKMLGKQPMVAALKKLRESVATQSTLKKIPSESRAFMINAVQKRSSFFWMRLFATHPPIEERIHRLKNL